MPDKYLGAPGHKEQGGASEAAAKDIKPKAATIRSEVLGVLHLHPEGLTADESAELLGLDILTVRPRFSELYRIGKIQKTGDRRESSRGKPSTVWQLKRNRTITYK